MANISSGTIKFTAPEKMALGPLGWYVSGEFGHQWLGTSDAFYGCIQSGINAPAPTIPNGIPYADYNTWNVGLGFTWKVFTLDLRYYDTDLSKGDCNAFTSDPTATLASATLLRLIRVALAPAGAARPLLPSCRLISRSAA